MCQQKDVQYVVHQNRLYCIIWVQNKSSNRGEASIFLLLLYKIKNNHLKYINTEKAP